MGNGAEVLALLGRTGEAQPLPASVAGLGAILRANALEKAGEVELASAELRRAATTVAQRLSQMATLAHLPPSWAVCARSLDAEARRRASERLALGDLAFPIAAGSAALLSGLTGAVALAGGEGLLVASTGLGAAAVALAAVAERRSKARQREIIASGRLVRGRVVHDPYEPRFTRHRETGRKGTRGWRFRVEDPHGEPRRVIVAPYLSIADAARLNGHEVLVLVHPAHPGEGVLAL
jgi:hypothetical protein